MAAVRSLCSASGCRPSALPVRLAVRRASQRHARQLPTSGAGAFDGRATRPDPRVRVDAPDARVWSARHSLTPGAPWISDGTRVEAKWDRSADVRALVFDRPAAEERARQLTGDDGLKLRTTGLAPHSAADARRWETMFAYVDQALALSGSDPLIAAELERHALMMTLSAFPTSFTEALRRPAQRAGARWRSAGRLPTSTRTRTCRSRSTMSQLPPTSPREGSSTRSGELSTSLPPRPSAGHDSRAPAETSRTATGARSAMSRAAGVSALVTLHHCIPAGLRHTAVADPGVTPGEESVRILRRVATPAQCELKSMARVRVPGLPRSVATLSRSRMTRAAIPSLCSFADGEPVLRRHADSDPDRRSRARASESRYRHQATTQRELHALMAASRGDAPGRSTLWLHPSIPLRFVFQEPESPDLSRKWIEELAHSASSSGGITLIEEHLESSPAE